MSLNQSFSLKNTPYHILITEDIESIQKEWNSVNVKDVFLSYDFLNALQKSPPSGVRNIFVFVAEEDTAIGVLLFQYKRVKLSHSIKTDTDKIVKSTALKCLSFNLLVSGNMAVTGEHSQYFNKAVDSEEIILKTIPKVRKFLKSKGVRISTVLSKDYYDSKQKFRANKYLEFQVEPNMIFDIKPSWVSVDDYTNDFKSKYRVRYRRARKKVSEISIRKLTISDLKTYKEDMHSLYKSIADQVNFNLFYLNQNYFIELATQLGDRFICNGYFLEDKLVGFITLIENDQILDAHFLGYDFNANHQHQLYANMLYDIIEHGIKHNYATISFSRTASEIKSSAGAVARDMNFYAKATNPLLNLFLRRGFKYFETTEEWQPRSPFKD